MTISSVSAAEFTAEMSGHSIWPMATFLASASRSFVTSRLNFEVGFRIVKIGGGWYVSHVGRNWGFKCSVASQKVKGCGFPIMAHGGCGDQIVAELRQRTEWEYGQDTLDKPVAG